MDRGEGYKRRFGRRERRAVLFLLPIVAVVGLILWGFANRRTISDEELDSWDGVYDMGDNENQGVRSYAANDGNDISRAELFEFDPNTVTYEELRRLGFSKSTAAGIIKYRTKGKRFEIKEDFATCYGVSDSAYAVLKPYIRIGGEYAAKPSAARSSYVDGQYSYAPNSADSIEPFNPNELDAEGFVKLGFTSRQSEVIIKFRDMRGGFRNAAEFGECYVVSEERFAQLAPYIVIDLDKQDEGTSKSDAPVELNGADSTTLVGIRGIGAKTASEVIAYRDRLGGFHSVEQLAELKVITESNYELIRKQIWVDSYVIRKIDINFASPEELERHPYMTAKRLRRILKNRQLKGGWCTIDDMVDDATLSCEEANTLAPYLDFTPLRDR